MELLIETLTVLLTEEDKCVAEICSLRIITCVEQWTATSNSSHCTFFYFTSHARYAEVMVRISSRTAYLVLGDRSQRVQVNACAVRKYCGNSR